MYTPGVVCVPRGSQSYIFASTVLRCVIVAFLSHGARISCTRFAADLCVLSELPSFRFVSSVRSGRAFELRFSALVRAFVSSVLVGSGLRAELRDVPSLPRLRVGVFGSIAFRTFSSGSCSPRRCAPGCCDASGPACPAVAAVAIFPQSDLELAFQLCSCSDRRALLLSVCVAAQRRRLVAAQRRAQRRPSLRRRDTAAS